MSYVPLYCRWVERPELTVEWEKAKKSCKAVYMSVSIYVRQQF